MITKTARQALILDSVSNGDSLEVATLAERLKVTGETIRRDIKELQAKGLVTKVHGGVMLPQMLSNTGFHERLKQNTDGKRRIGAAVAAIVRDGDSLIIETGTTATFVAQALTARRGLTVVTNSVDVARSLAFRADNAVYMTGGRLSPDDGAALDQSAAEYISRFRVKYAIFSVAGVDPRDGLTTNSVAEADFSRLVVSRADIPLLAVDRSKFGRKGLVRVVETSQVKLVVTDADIDDNYQVLFQSNEVIKV